MRDERSDLSEVKAVACRKYLRNWARATLKTLPADHPERSDLELLAGLVTSAG